MAVHVGSLIAGKTSRQATIAIIGHSAASCDENRRRQVLGTPRKTLRQVAKGVLAELEPKERLRIRNAPCRETHSDPHG